MTLPVMAFDPVDGFRNTVTYPDPETEPQGRDQVQDGLDQLRDFINDDLSPAVDELVSTHKAEVTSYVATVSRDISLPDGDQIISLVAGRTPKKITIYAAIPGLPTSCWGVVGSNAQAVIEQGSDGNAVYNTPAIYLSPSAGNASSGTITIQSGQITIAWTKTGSPTGTASIIVIADYHD